jgi:hypothetical protein
LLTILQGHRTLADVSVMQWNSKTSTYRPAAPVGPTRYRAYKPTLLKPHTAPGGGRSRHLKFPAKLPRQALNECQPR